MTEAPTARAHVLVVEDEAAIRLALAGLLSRDGYAVTCVSTGGEALVQLAGEPSDLVLTDLALGAGPSGMDVLAAARARWPGTPVVVITAHGSERIAVDAMKAGAEDYVPKPFDNDHLRLVVRRALERTRLLREHRLLVERVGRDHGLGALVGSGPAMQRVFATIQKVAETDLGVLVRGESGTGKELVAQAIHERSPRAGRPFVAVNCAAIQQELVESELFGHEKGSFTGADARRIGRFEAASSGTIFLDEIGDMAPATQAKALRVLEERRFERVGGTRTVDADVRVVAATHKDLEAEIARGTFRQDLYYRLRVVELVLPPLRERPEDVPALVARFLSQLATRLGRATKSVSAPALAALARHRWPGNVRELRNVLERAAVLAPGDAIELADLALDGAPPSPVERLTLAEAKKRVAEDYERHAIAAALRDHDGNVTHAAEALGLARQSLQQRIKELGLKE